MLFLSLIHISTLFGAEGGMIEVVYEGENGDV